MPTLNIMIDPVLQLVVQWLAVFAINVIPAFAPPTWVLLSFFYIVYPQNIFLLIFIGVTASTVGRYALAKGSELITQKYASTRKKKGLEELRHELNYKPWEKFFFTLVFSLSPLPSNALFIAAGATRVRLREVLAGFFVGRTISYLLLVFVTQKVFSALETTLAGNATIWTGMIEIIGFASIIAFFVLDWEKILGQKKESKKWPNRKK
jgi:membrane protein YqaA with SNARE-associated domain